MNTRVYRNSNEQNRGNQPNRWGEPSRSDMVRSATPMERAKSRAAGYSAIIVIVVLCMAVTFAAIALNANPKNKTGQVGGDPIVFAAPVSGDFTVTKYYSDSKLQWNETAKQWQGFKAMNFQSELGTAIVATYAGTVTEVSTSATYGTVVKIQHKDGVMTVYSGLDEALEVKKGDTVVKGQRIGKFGDTLNLEAKSGPTLRMEVYENGKKVNPEKYLVLSENK